MEDSVTLDLTLEIYLKFRQDPLHWQMHLDVGEAVTSISEVMSFAYASVWDILDSRTEDHILLVDSRFSQHVVMIDEIQAFSILAPDKESLPWSED